MKLLLTACQRAEEEAEAERGGNSSSLDSSDEEETILHTAFSDDGLSEADSLTSEENEWEDDEGEQERSSFWINSGNTSYAKEKLIRILAGEALVPK